MSYLRYIISEVQWCVLMLMIHCFTISQASAATSQDSTHFVTASLMVISPGNEIYSVFGHCVLHMQCPSKHLDYVYTFETEPNYLKFFAGKSKACFVAVPTREFLQQYKAEGRGVTEYALNLTPHEKQELWRALDEDMKEGPRRCFTFFRNNCVTLSLLMVESVLQNEYIDFSHTDRLMKPTNGEGIRYLSRHAPWAEFVFMTFLGNQADGYWPAEDRMAPELITTYLKQGSIVCTQNSHIRRPVFTGKETRLLPLRVFPTPTGFTPIVFSVIFLLLIIVLTVAEHLYSWEREQGVTNTLLFALQTLLGCSLLYFSLVSNLFGRGWNWYLIPFNPLPLVVWLCFRHRPQYNNVYAVYALILLMFIVVTPFITDQVDAAHLIIVAALMVRCADRYYNGRKEQRNMISTNK